MGNDKNHLYTKDDFEKDIKGTAKRKTQQGFSRFSVPQTKSITEANESANSPAVQITTKPQIGEPVDDSIGAIGAITQIIGFETFGSRHTILSILGDVDFAFERLPQGRWIDFSLDMVINTPTPPTITLDPRTVNPPTLAVLAENDRLFLHFIGVRDDTSTRFYFLNGALNGGSIGGGGGGGFRDSVRAVMEVPQGQVAYPEILSFGIGDKFKISGFIMPADVDSFVNCKVEVPLNLAGTTDTKIRFQWINLGVGMEDFDSVIVTVRRIILGAGEQITSLTEEAAQQVIVANLTNTKGGTEISLTSEPTAGETIFFQIYRKGTSTLDTYPGDILVYVSEMEINRVTA